ncbi:MAG: 2-oxoadipate dioxygenase/decarboxylase family protein [Steroidobacteraceae bacterium]
MTNTQVSALQRLLSTVCSGEECAALRRAVYVSPPILEPSADDVPRAVLTQALNLLLLRDLLARVPTGRQYVEDRVSQGYQIVFDHGALRTVSLQAMGDLPAGEHTITRVLVPLGYRLGSLYPLDRLGMTGRSYTHVDFPEELPQFFVSELHPERFSPGFQAAVARVTASSRDPLSRFAKGALEEIGRAGSLPFDAAARLLPELLACFQRQHAIPRLEDYQILLKESAEMAWIATEGNAFNHATDRVHFLDALVAEQRRLSRPLKDSIEISRSGRVRQTAFRADPIEREFVDSAGAVIRRQVPGSFFEFIQRDRIHDPATRVSRLDLAFDTGNAQGIFKMTAAA